MQRVQRTYRHGETAGIDPDRVVRPRKRGYKPMRIAVAYDNWIFDQDDYWTRDIPGYVYSIPPTIFVIADAGWFLGTLIDAYGDHPDFTFKLTQPEQDRETARISRTLISSFGFYRPISPTDQNSVRRKPLRARQHQCWDVHGMTQTTAYSMVGEAKITRENMFRFACDVRAWAQEQNLELRNSLSGYANQLLRDQRFYPEPRRRVPRQTNERARPHLPGNRVELMVDPDITHAYDVTTIDQRSAHHRIVQTLTLPSADTLYARGYFHSPDNAEQYFAHRSDPNYSRTIRLPGMLCVGLHSRPTEHREFRLKKQDFAGFRKVYLWTNEIEFIESTGSHIEGIYAAWSANTTDTGLAQYGAWAQVEIESATDKRKQWLKPLLHSTYGLLAAKPRALKFGYRHANSGTPDSFMLGNREIPVMSHTLQAWAPASANVIQRGLIEAETQLRSLRMAQHLTSQGCTVLHIQTDGIHLLGNLPTNLPGDWKIGELTYVQYIDNVSWVAFESSCLPGRDAHHRLKIYEQLARHHSHNSQPTTPRGQDRRTLQAQR